MTAAGLTYDADVQQGLVPEHSGACVLFVEWDTVPARTTSAETHSPERHEELAQ